MFSRIKKWLVKQFIPTADEIAELLAEKVATFINTQDESTQNKIMKYSEISIKVEEILHELSHKLRDGRIDEGEEKDLVKKILPWVKQGLDKVMEAL